MLERRIPPKQHLLDRKFTQFAVKIRNPDAALVAEVASDRDFFQKQRDRGRFPAGIYDNISQAAHDIEGRYASNAPLRELKRRDSTKPKRMPRLPARRMAGTTGKPTGTLATAGLPA